MSIDFEKVTIEELKAMPYSHILKYTVYWQELKEDGVEIEWFHEFEDKWRLKINDKLAIDYLYRRKAQPKIVPLDFSDFLDIKDKWIIDTRTNERCFIVDYKLNCELLLRYEKVTCWITFENLQKYFTRLDGSRFEKEVAV